MNKSIELVAFLYGAMLLFYFVGLVVGVATKTIEDNKKEMFYAFVFIHLLAGMFLFATSFSTIK